MVFFNAFVVAERIGITGLDIFRYIQFSYVFTLKTSIKHLKWSFSANKANGFQSLIIFAETSNRDVSEGSEYGSDYHLPLMENILNYHAIPYLTRLHNDVKQRIINPN